MERFRVQNAPSVDPGGALAGTNVGADLGSILSNFARSGAALVAPIERGAAAREGLNAGLAGGTERRSEITAAGRIFNEQMQAGFEARTLSQLRAGLQEVAAAHPGNTLEDVAAFREKSEALWGGLRQGIPQEMQAGFDLEYQERASRMGSSIQARAMANQRTLDINAHKAGMGEVLEDAQVAARDGDTEALAMLTQRYAQGVDRLVEFGELSPDAVENARLDFAEAVLAEGFYGDFLREGAPVSKIVALEQGSIGKELSIQQRDALVGKMRAEVSRRRTEARNAQTDALLAVRTNDLLADTITAKVENGVALTEEEQKFRDAAFRGQVPLSPKSQSELLVSSNVEVWSEALADRAPDEAIAMVSQFDQPTTLEEAAVQEGARRAAKAHVEALNGPDALGYLTERGLVRLAPIDVSSPDALRRSLADPARVTAVQEMSKKYGVQVPALTRQEADTIASQVDQMGADELANVVATAVGAHGPNSADLLASLGQKRPSLPIAGLLYASGDEEAGTNIVRASQNNKARRDAGLDVPSPAKDDLRLVRMNLGIDRGLTSTAATNAIEAGAMEIYADMMARGGAAVDPSQALIDAYTMAGWRPGSFHDSQVLLPPNMDAATFADRMGGITANDIMAAGGVFGDYGAEQLAEDIRNGDVEITTLEPGAYGVRVGGVDLFQADGRKVLEIDAYRLGTPVRDQSKVPGQKFVEDVARGARGIGQGLDEAAGAFNRGVDSLLAPVREAVR